MDLTINISNADESVLHALEAFFKMRPELKIKINQNEEKPASLEEEILESVKEAEEAWKKGTVRAFKSPEEYREIIQKGKGKK